MTDRGESEELKHLLNDFYFRLEERDRWADQTLRFLLTGNGGGVALLMALLGALGKNGQWVPALLLPLSLFLLGVVVVGIVIGYSTACVRKGRRELRTLIVRYLDEDISYTEAFKAMGTLPSKWRGFGGGCWVAFGCFVAGVIASGAVYLSNSRPAAVIVQSQNAGSGLSATPAGDKRVSQKSGANGTSQHLSGQRRAEAAEANRR